jgi:hypothetical protein
MDMIFIPFTEEAKELNRRKETYYNIKEDNLYYRGYKTYIVCSAVWDKTESEEQEDTCLMEGSCEGSTWDKTESYSHMVKSMSREITEVFKGIKVEKSTRLGYKTDSSGEWIPLTANDFKDLKFYDNYVDKYKRHRLNNFK